MEKIWQQIADTLGGILYGFKTYFLPAEPYMHAFNAAIGAGVGTVLNDQAVDLRLPYDIYIYDIGLVSTGVFDFSIRASGGGVLFSENQVRSTTLWSAAEPVYRLRRPFKVAAGASLAISMTNQIAGANTVQIVFVAWKSRSQFARPEA